MPIGQVANRSAVQFFSTQLHNVKGRDQCYHYKWRNVLKRTVQSHPWLILNQLSYTSWECWMILYRLTFQVSTPFLVSKNLSSLPNSWVFKQRFSFQSLCPTQSIALSTCDEMSLWNILWYGTNLSKCITFDYMNITWSSLNLQTMIT